MAVRNLSSSRQFLRPQWELESEWIPRAENEIADYISRITDCDDWLLNPHYCCLGTEAIDAFTCDRDIMIPAGGILRCFWFPDY